MSAGHDFNWYGDEADIAIPDQAAIAVYHNPSGDIVIRQRQEWPEEQDALILVTLARASTLARAILAAAGEGEPGPALRDVTGALRQRRCRERHRNGATQDGERHPPEAQS